MESKLFRDFEDKWGKRFVEMHDDITSIKVALKGYNGNTGLCQDHANLKSEFFKFRRTCFIIVGILIGSGTLGLSIFEILK